MNINKKTMYLLIELLAVILIVTGIALIYLPVAFIVAGSALLILIHVKEEEENAIEKSN